MRDLTPEYLLAALRQAIKTKGLTYRELSEKWACHCPLLRDI